jgi:phosphoserine phosphatase
MVAVLFSGLAAAQAADPLPSWNDGKAKQSIIAFVHRATTPGTADFVPPDARVATFDNDGTLWAEKPLYFQVFFALDRVKELAPQHPEWKTQEPFASLLKGDLKAALAGGDKALIEIVMATHAGMTTTEFEAIVKQWIATARHPQTKMRFTEMVYQPMLELLAYLRANGFKTFIVSGGGIEFMRPWAEAVYGVPPDQVVGSSIKTEFQMTPNGPVLMRLPQVDFIDDKEGKPVGINAHIGMRPTAAFGNSDGDLQMLQWATMWPGARFGLLVHHTDATREYAYDTGAAAALAEAQKRGWTIVDMKNDWKVIY